jgi:hypothetical protein
MLIFLGTATWFGASVIVASLGAWWHMRARRLRRQEGLPVAQVRRDK